MKATKVQKLVFSMLTENTGSHLLDSGGIYGRNHERNAKKTISDFINEDAERVTLEIYGERAELHRTVSVFHFLSNLELDEVCNKFNRLNKNAENWNFDDAYGVCTKAGEYLQNIEAEISRTWNTYNGESDLSQVLQGANLRIFIDGQYEDYMLVQIHGGCDVRGGYTDARLFKVTDEFYYLREYMSESELIDEIEQGLPVYNNLGEELPKDEVLSHFVQA